MKRLFAAVLAATVLLFAVSCGAPQVQQSKEPSPTPRPSGDWCEYEGCDQLAVRDFAGETGPVRYCQEHFDMALEKFHEENQRARPTAEPEQHPCDEPGCTNMAALSITDGSGETKFYCLIHYKALLEILGAEQENWSEVSDLQSVEELPAPQVEDAQAPDQPQQ